MTRTVHDQVEVVSRYGLCSGRRLRHFPVLHSLLTAESVALEEILLEMMIGVQMCCCCLNLQTPLQRPEQLRPRAGLGQSRSGGSRPKRGAKINVAMLLAAILDPALLWLRINESFAGVFIACHAVVTVMINTHGQNTSRRLRLGLAGYDDLLLFPSPSTHLCVYSITLAYIVEFV